MRRAAVWAGVLALAAVAAGSARWPVAPARVADALNASAGGSRPLTWSAPQLAAFSALPWPNLRIIDARLNESSGVNVVTATEARVDLSLVDLLLGRVAPTRVTLDQPTIALDLDRAPFVGRLDPVGVIAAIGGFAPLGSVSLSNGVVRVTGQTRGLDMVIEGLRGRLDGLSPGSRIRVDLTGLWRDAPLVVSGSLDDPRRAVQDKPSALNVAIVSSLGDLAFSGALTAGPALGAAGDLSVSSHALAEVFRLFGVTAAPALAGADVSISGKVKATPGDLTFDEATVTSGGQTLQGALRLARMGGRLAISGSLDAEQLALAPLFGAPQPLFAADGGWSYKTFPLSLPGDVDLDLRLSAGRLDVYGVGLDNAAASALVKDGALTANLVEATAYGGRLEGELNLACDRSRFRLTMRAKLADADIGAAASDFGWPELTGKGTADIAIETAGGSPAEFIAGLFGKASFDLVDGAVSGVNLEEALRRSQRRPLDVAKDMRSGGTAFERASLAVIVGEGVAHVVSGELVASGVRADVQGAVDLAARSLNLRLNAAQAAPTGDAPPGAAHLGLKIDGPWANPTVQAIEEPDAVQPGAPPSEPSPPGPDGP